MIEFHCDLSSLLITFMVPPFFFRLNNKINTSIVCLALIELMKMYNSYYIPARHSNFK